MSTPTYNRDRLIALFKRDALRLGTFKLTSGRTSHCYVDGRKITLSAEGAALIGLGIFDLIQSHINVHAIGGLSLGADAIVGAVLAVYGMQGFTMPCGFLVRKEAKKHGMSQLIEGDLRANDRVLIVDDVATTGGSILQAADAVIVAGGTVVQAVVVLDRLEGAAEACARRGIGLESLLTIRDLGIEPLAPSA